jgi:hypothetical protein
MVVTDDLPIAPKKPTGLEAVRRPQEYPLGVSPTAAGGSGAADPAKESAIRRAFIGTLVKRVQERVRNDDKKPHKSFV